MYIIITSERETGAGGANNKNGSIYDIIIIII